MTDYTTLTQDLSKYVAKLHKELPDVMQPFANLAKGATQNKAIDKKAKEMIALGIAIAVRCDGCIGFHTQTLCKLGLTREELLDVLGMSVYMGGGPSLMYAAEALKAFEEFSG